MWAAPSTVRVCVTRTFSCPAVASFGVIKETSWHSYWCYLLMILSKKNITCLTNCQSPETSRGALPLGRCVLRTSYNSTKGTRVPPEFGWWQWERGTLTEMATRWEGRQTRQHRPQGLVRPRTGDERGERGWLWAALGQACPKAPGRPPTGRLPSVTLVTKNACPPGSATPQGLCTRWGRSPLRGHQGGLIGRN